MYCIQHITARYIRDVDLDLDLHSVRIVRAIAELGTISAAARSLGYSQPAISQHLRRAEARLGFPLVIRSGRGVELTEPGRSVASHSVAILSAFDALGGELSDLAGLGSGTVRIAAFPSASSTLIPRLLKMMRVSHPGITVTYIEAEPPEALAMLRDGLTDLAITFSYPGDRADPHKSSGELVETVPLFSEKVLLVMPDDHPLATGNAVRLDDLAQERWIAGCPLCRGHLLAVCDAAGITPDIELETDNAVAVVSLVSEGLGIALLPQLALATATVSAGVSVHPTVPSSDRSIQILAQSGARRVPSVGTTISALLELNGEDWGLKRTRR